MSKFMSSLEKRLEDPEFRAGYEESKEQRERGSHVRSPIERAAVLRQTLTPEDSKTIVRLTTKGDK